LLGVGVKLERKVTRLKFSAALMLAFVSIVSSAFAVGRASDPEDELISKKLVLWLTKHQ
jgi:hypothetical protein